MKATDEATIRALIDERLRPLEEKIARLQDELALMDRLLVTAISFLPASKREPAQRKLATLRPKRRERPFGLGNIEPRRGKFRARVMVDGRNQDVGTFDTREEAEAALRERTPHMHTKRKGKAE